MKLNTITRIEQFLVDALISSEHIPLGVNVVRLAAVEDEEGIARMARSIVVRYTGSSVNVEQKVPVVSTRTMTFEIIHSAQSYLSESGHDYALQMCAGANMTLDSQIPLQVGVNTLTPFHMVSESFEGLSDSSHYTYVQRWDLETKSIHKLVSLDPCVLSGNCRYLFPETAVQQILPGEVLYENKIFAPVMPPLVSGFPYEEEMCGVIENGTSLVYTESGYDNTVFVSDWRDKVFTHTNTFDETNTFLICHIRDRKTMAVLETYFASWCGERRVIQIGGAQPGRRGFLGGVYISKIGELGNPDSSVGETLNPTYHGKNGYGYTNKPTATIYADPTDPDAPKDITKWGVLHHMLVGAELLVDLEEYYYISQTRLGKAWIKKDDFTLLKGGSESPFYCDFELPEVEGDVNECG